MSCLDGMENRSEDGVKFGEHLGVPEAQDLEALIVKPAIPLIITFVVRGFCMLPTVDLDDESRIARGEIYDVPADGNLASELDVRDLTPS